MKTYLAVARTLAIGLCAVVVGCVHPSPRADDVRREILEAERRREAAQLRGDWQTIQRLNAPDFIDVGGAGVIRTGPQNAEAMRSGTLRFQTVENSDQEVRVYHDVAIVTGISHRTGSYAGSPFEQRLRYTRVYVRENGVWRAVLAQNTRLADTTR
jgi:ketosteroid isomerase-like protein